MYVNASLCADSKPGISRKRHGKQFSYYDTAGKRIRDSDIISRIHSLAIPPAYREVWICPLANGHIQATGLDNKGRKQYRYHPKWRMQQEENKFEHILYFGERLPGIRQRVERDIQVKGLTRNKVIAAVVQLLEKTLIRVGNSEYARSNHSYGLTTLRNKHVHVKGAEIIFKFTGKSGKQWNLTLHDRRIASIVKRCSDIPGFELFKYLDDEGKTHDITSADVNAYLKDISGEDFTAKDYRTWSATVLATLALKEFDKFNSATEAKKNILRAIEKVAKHLGNTPTICRKSYIHPEVINAYLDGEFSKMVEHEIDKTIKDEYEILTTQEIMVLTLLRKRLHKN